MMPIQDQQKRTVTVTDMSGDEVTITGEVKRIVNLWPAGTSSFFILGAGDLIIGLAVNSPATMTAWTQLFYPESINIPSLGGVTPSIEDLINLKPDLVIIHPTTAASGLAQQIRDVGIPAINIYFSNYESMVKAYTILGEVLGGEYQKIEPLVFNGRRQISKVRKITSEIAEEDRPVVFYIAGQSDGLTKLSVQEQLLQTGLNQQVVLMHQEVMGLTSTGVTPEAIWDLNPDIMICAGVYQHVTKMLLKAKKAGKI